MLDLYPMHKSQSKGTHNREYTYVLEANLQSKILIWAMFSKFLLIIPIIVFWLVSSLSRALIGVYAIVGKKSKDGCQTSWSVSKFTSIDLFVTSLATKIT